MRKTITTLAVAATTTMLLSGAGLAAASTSSAGKAGWGTEHFYLMTTQRSSARYEVIATGVFTTAGVDISGNTTDTARLPGGTFKIHHGGAVHVITEKLNPQTCLGVFKGTSGFWIGGGTGKYAGIHGSGMAVISERAVFARLKGVCNPNLTPVANEQTITGTAHLKL
jgi:hypothetical protein